MVPFPYAQVHTVRICYFALITSWVVFLLFSLKNMTYIFSKKEFTVFRFPLCLFQFKRVLAQRRQQRFWITVTYGFFFAWYSFTLHLWMALQSVFTDADFWKTESSLF